MKATEIKTIRFKIYLEYLLPWLSDRAPVQSMLRIVREPTVIRVFEPSFCIWLVWKSDTWLRRMETLELALQ